MPPVAAWLLGALGIYFVGLAALAVVLKFAGERDVGATVALIAFVALIPLLIVIACLMDSADL